MRDGIILVRDFAPHHQCHRVVRPSREEFEIIREKKSTQRRDETQVVLELQKELDQVIVDGDGDGWWVGVKQRCIFTYTVDICIHTRDVGGVFGPR